MSILIANIFGFVSLLVSIFIYQASNKRKFLLRQIIYTFFILLEFILLKAYIAFFVSLISLLRSVAFYIYNNKNKVIPKIFILILIGLFLLSLKYTYQNIYSFIPPFIGIVYTLSLQIKDVNIIKKICIVLSILWIVYYVVIKAYISIFARLFDIGSILIYFIKIKKNFKK